MSTEPIFKHCLCGEMQALSRKTKGGVTMSQLPGASIAINRAYLDSLQVEGRILGAVRPDTTFPFCGRV